MVTLKKDKLIIEIDSDSPDELLKSFQNTLINSVQLIQELQESNFNQEAAMSCFFLLELYKSLIEKPPLNS
jgi:hypothetical protein